MANFIDITGQRFGRLIAQCYERQKFSAWRCRCDCGTDVVVLTNNLRRGTSQSCGCLRRELLGIRKRKHGGAAGGKCTHEYLCWASAKQRCTDPGSKSYKNYGGRGITMCDKWLHDFAAFLRDMGPCDKAHTLERIDNSRGYSPDNCRWATTAEQSINTRRNVRVEFNGASYTVSQLAETYGLKYHAIYHLVTKGVGVADAIVRIHDRVTSRRSDSSRRMPHKSQTRD